MRRRRWPLAAVAVLLLAGSPVSAFDGRTTFARGTVVASIEGGGGADSSLEHHPRSTEIEFWNAGVRLSLLPFGSAGTGPLVGALEVGLEPFYQRYGSGLRAFYAGLAAVGRYHFLALGRFVPYLEIAAAAGGTDLSIREIDSDFAFLLFGGAGASVFVTDTTALYAGYRLQHVSNGGYRAPNRGFESHTGVIGLSTYFK
ncbi:MAG: acyloxyacyl hydrolase [Candidatus Rokuibacteriota bacterium]